MISAPQRRRARSLIFPCLAAVTAAALLTWSDAALAQDVPFNAVVTDEKVEVRAGPGRAYYVVDTLERGDRVRVVQTLYDWSKIEAPASSFSYISQAFVNARGDGSVGVVNTDRQEVKAGSLQGPGVSYKTQAMLNRGDEVKILATEGDYYKIEPPDNAFVYLPPGSLRPAGPRDDAPPREATRPRDAGADPDADERAAEDRAEARPTSAEPSERDPVATRDAEPSDSADDEDSPVARAEDDATRSGTNPEAGAGAGAASQDEPGDEPASGEPAGEDEDDADDAASVTLSREGRDQEPGEMEIDIAKGQDIDVVTETTALAELEARAIPELKKPVEEQPIQDLLAAYRSLRDREDVELTPSERQLVSLRIAVLQRNLQLREALAKIEASQQAEEEPPAATRDAGEAESPEAPPRDRVAARDFDAVGKLLASSVYDGRSLPRMYRLVDPTARRTLAYLAPADVDARAMLGKLVGVRGESQYDPSLKLRIFEVESIEVLSGD